MRLVAVTAIVSASIDPGSEFVAVGVGEEHDVEDLGVVDRQAVGQLDRSTRRSTP